MKSNQDLQAKTIADLAARCDAPNQFDNFDRVFRASLTVSKADVAKEERRLKRLRAKRQLRKRSA
jgi:hypothetical protein